MYKILQAIPGSGYQLHLVYSDEKAITIDMMTFIDKGGVFSQLKDPALFQQVEVGENGRFISWPNEIDLCADALRGWERVKVV